MGEGQGEGQKGVRLMVERTARGVVTSAAHDSSVWEPVAEEMRGKRTVAERLPLGAIAALGFGMLGISLAWQIYNACIPIFLQAGRPDFNAGASVRGFA